MQVCVHITDNRRRRSDEKIKEIQEHEGLQNKRISLQANTDDYTAGSVALGTWLQHRGSGSGQV